jgi:hypothetical protein
MNHEKCSNNIIKKTIKEFNKKELKLSNDKIVKDKKQAIAIALTSANRKCSYNKEEFKELENKIKNFLYSDDNNIPLSGVIETKKIIKMYIENKKYKKAYLFTNLLIKRVINTKLTSNIIKELLTLPQILNI